MTVITNYGELKQAIAETAHRNDQTANIPGFVQLAESRMAMELRYFQIDQDTSLTDADRAVGSSSYNKPNDWLEPVAIAWSPVNPPPAGVEFKNLVALNYSSLSALSFSSGDPVGYYVANGLAIKPTPPAGSIIFVQYLARQPALINDADTNQILEDNSDIYLYGALQHLGIFVQDMEMAQAYGELMGAAMQIANDQAQRYNNRGPAIIEGASSWV